MLQTIDQEDYDFLWNAHYNCVREGFKKQNLEARQKEWNRKAKLYFGIAAVIACVIITYNQLK